MSDTLRCGTCQRDLPDDDFHKREELWWRHKRRFRNYECRECVADRFERASERNRKLIHEAKDVPCADCGVRYPFWIMQFDHVRGEKLFVLSSTSSRALQKVKDEIAKCDVVCANCHRIRTYKSQQQARHRGETVGYVVPRGARRAPKTQTPSLPDALTLF